MYMEPEQIDGDELVRGTRAAIGGLEELGDDLGLARAWTLLGDVLGWAKGDMAAAAEAHERAAEHARRSGSPRDEASVWGALAMVLLYGPMPADMARRTTARLLEEAAGKLVLEANLAGFLASHEAMTGDFDAARAHIAQSCDRLNDLGLKWQAGIQELLRGYIEMFAGDPVAAERHMRAAIESFVAIGDRWFLSGALVDVARPVYEQGRYDDALALVEGIDEIPAPADREWEIKRWGIRARLLARDGEAEEAERCARRGVAAGADTDLLWFHADALIDLTEVLRMSGRPEEAARAAAEALALYERKGIVPSAARTRALLDELGAASVGG
jgi:tetratricopeptide (TPR) repeat protein